ncbi:hypothetical protein DPMN_030693 [Dreissena polymorpha]|uniref:Uncharacterized protein n=1 Tax=Dreissena polymorpha TaxID=45954 RepID=A0A9D4M0V4_DREPO|nr:hypothetical protein DPMN_030693 [Dreissena polymorpha]
MDMTMIGEKLEEVTCLKHTAAILSKDGTSTAEGRIRITVTKNAPTVGIEPVISRSLGGHHIHYTTATKQAFKHKYCRRPLRISYMDLKTNE